MEVALFRSQLFLDSELVAFTSPTIRRTVHPARTLDEPVLAPEPGRPWEYGGEQYSKRVTLYGTVLHSRSEGLWRMWYM